MLLEGIDQVHLTSLPTGWTTGEPLDMPVPLDAILPPGEIRVPGAKFKSRADATWAVGAAEGRAPNAPLEVGRTRIPQSQPGCLLAWAPVQQDAGAERA